MRDGNGNGNGDDKGNGVVGCIRGSFRDFLDETIWGVCEMEGGCRGRGGERRGEERVCVCVYFVWCSPLIFGWAVVNEIEWNYDGCSCTLTFHCVN